MAYFVTGATGFIGRHLVQELLDNRDDEIFVLVRSGSKERIDRLLRSWGNPARVSTVTGDLTKPRLGVTKKWAEAHRGSIDHFFHVAALYDMTASDELNEQLNVGGTRAALELAGALDAGVFHQVSSIAASGDYHGTFDETMFDVGQGLPSSYHRTKFESERIVREECPVPWRVYRPAVVVGHSETGAMDKVDGPYYFFPLFKRMRDTLPAWLPILGVDLGDTNVVPVDYVAKAMDHIAHQPGPRRPGVPPGQPRAAGRRRHGQHVRRGRQGAAVRGPARPARHRGAADQRAAAGAAPRRAGAERAAHRARAAGAPRDHRPARHPARGARARLVPDGRTPPAAPSGRSPAPGSPAPTSRATPRRCGPTGRSTSTGTPPATAASSTSSATAPW